MGSHGFIFILILRPRMTSIPEQSLYHVINYSRIILLTFGNMTYSMDGIYTAIPTLLALCFNSFHNFPKNSVVGKNFIYEKAYHWDNGKLYELFIFLFVQSGKSTYVHIATWLMQEHVLLSAGAQSFPNYSEVSFWNGVRKLVTKIFAFHAQEYSATNITNGHSHDRFNLKWKK